MTSPDAMPAFPERLTYGGYGHAENAERQSAPWQRACAAAWEARCRYLMELLAHIENCSDKNEWPHQEVKQAIAFVGPLPEEAK